MPVHVVQQGECLSSLGARGGFTPGVLHNHPDNAALKKRRPDPNILAPGDEVVIPAPNVKAVTCSTEQKHRFVVNVPKVKLRIAMMNAAGEPYEGKRFVVTVGKKEIPGTTGNGGKIEVEVPATAQRANLRMWLDDDDVEPHFDRELAIGHLDPIDSITGVQGRLANLGHPCLVSGEVDDATMAALRGFRARAGLPEITPPTKPASDRDADTDADTDNDNDAGADAETDADRAEEARQAKEAYIAALLGDDLRAKLQSLYEGKA